MWDLEHTKEPVYTAKAHASIVNQIDGTGGQVSCLAASIHDGFALLHQSTKAPGPLFSFWLLRVPHSHATNDDSASLHAL